MPELNELEKVLQNELLHSPEELQKLMIDYKEKIEDLRTIKDIVFKLLKQLGVVSSEGVVRENISIRDISGIVFKMLSNLNKIKDEMGYMTDLLPLIEKYKDL